jgi:hypothetical protein
MILSPHHFVSNFALPSGIAAKIRTTAVSAAAPPLDALREPFPSLPCRDLIPIQPSIHVPIFRPFARFAKLRRSAASVVPCDPKIFPPLIKKSRQII